MSEIKRYPNAVLKLQYFEGFNEQFETLMAECAPAKAYDLTENLHQHYFGRCKYASYESFRVIRSQQLKKLGKAGI